MTALGPQEVWAIMPSHGEPPTRALLEEVLLHVAGLTIVQDGSKGPNGTGLKALAEAVGASLVSLPERRGKGAALRAGLVDLLARRPTILGVVTIDADGQHPPSALPRFLAAGGAADLVIGDRFDDLGSMPWKRRLANRASRRLLQLSTGRPVRDTQCGMRLLRGRALAIPLEGDGYEAESRHLKAVLERGLAVAWVPIPAIYEDEQSSFRALRDSARVVAALLRPVATYTPSRGRLELRTGFRRSHPTSSARPGTAVTEPPEPQSGAPAL